MQHPLHHNPPLTIDTQKQNHQNSKYIHNNKILQLSKQIKTFPIHTLAIYFHGHIRIPSNTRYTFISRSQSQLSQTSNSRVQIISAFFKRSLEKLKKKNTKTSSINLPTPKEANRSHITSRYTNQHPNQQSIHPKSIEINPKTYVPHKNT